jgi:hypothetical protein
MLSNSFTVGMMRRIVAMKNLSSCSRSNTEGDGVVELRKTDTLFIFISNLKIVENEQLFLDLGMNDLPNYA